GGPECTVYAFGDFFTGSESRAVATDDGEKKDGDGEKKDGDGEKKDGDGGEKTGEKKDGEKKDGEKKPGPPKPKLPASFDEMLKQQKDRYAKSPSLDFKMEVTATLRFGSDQGRIYEGEVRQGRSRKRLLGAAVKRGGFEVAVIYEAPDTKDYLKAWRPAFRTSAKSLRILRDSEMKYARKKLDRKLDREEGDQGRWLRQVIEGLPKGWDHRRTKNYLIVYDKSIEKPAGWPGLISKLEKRLERLRKEIYEEEFPSDRPITAVSVVKVVQDPKQYAAYGAPAGSAGYWSWPTQELVFFANVKKRKRADIKKAVQVTLDTPGSTRATATTSPGIG
ncbi:MAG: hypothetical protein ACYTDX_11210, partial [Planctomycetota bacterium]